MRFKELSPSLNNASELAGRLPKMTPGFIALSMFLYRNGLRGVIGKGKNVPAVW